MACGIAVKRSLELDPHHSPETVKRPKLAQGMRTSPPLTCAGTSGICSPFMSSTTITSDQISSYVRDEVKILQRRKLIPRHRLGGGPPSPSSCGFLATRASAHTGSGSDSDGMMEEPPSAMHMVHHQQQQHHDHQPLFTMQQVELICSRLLKEREEHLRGEYEQILHSKLAEQYEMFSKFAQDQIYRRAQESTSHAASYLS